MPAQLKGLNMRRFMSLAMVMSVTACTTVSGPVAPAFTGQQGMLQAHNQVRARLGLPALTWSGELVRYSQSWANHLVSNNSCRMQHRSHAGSNPKKYGENLFWGSALKWSDGRRESQKITAQEVAREWAIEVQHYSYSRNSCRPGEQCGHYTQMVWRDTRQVGCAMTLCPDQGQIWVCSYNPPGNWVGQRPY
uniref:SCP-like extracellular n=1 Tax=uncultured Thiotrichaceae bacterium TaxID=298394 RepID=A0A6S6SD88_9GAMM